MSKAEIITAIGTLAKKYLDINDDDKLDIEDLKALFTKLKNVVDTNQDGNIDKKEMSVALKKLKIFLSDIAGVLVLTFGIMYLTNMQTFVTLLVTWDTGFWSQFATLAVFISGIMGVKEKYANDIKAAISKVQSKDEVIAELEAKIKSLNGIIANNAAEKEKALLEQEVASLKEQLDSLKTNVANTTAISLLSTK